MIHEPVQRLFKTLALMAGVISIAESPRLALANPKESITSEAELSTKHKQKSLHEICDAVAKRGYFSGAVLVAEDSQVIYRKAFGLANREWEIPNSIETKIRLASVSKQFCSMIIMQLIKDRKLELTESSTTQLRTYRQDS